MFRLRPLKGAFSLIHTIVAAALGDRDPQAAETRRRCGAVAGGIGILLNVLLFAGKLTAGLLTASVAMIADAVNNLSDAASSVVTLIGFHLASQAADAEHPFGHGRMEYVSGLIVSLAILLMGFEVGRSALETLLHPEDTAFSPLALVILAAAIGVKLWMYFFNRAMGRALKSAAMEATAADSLSDVASTLVVLLSALCAAAAMVVGSAGFSALIGVSSRYALVYGSLASLMICLVWLYFCGNVLLLGAILGWLIVKKEN